MEQGLQRWICEANLSQKLIAEGITVYKITITMDLRIQNLFNIIKIIWNKDYNQQLQLQRIMVPL